MGLIILDIKPTGYNTEHQTCANPFHMAHIFVSTLYSCELYAEVFAAFFCRQGMHLHLQAVIYVIMPLPAETLSPFSGVSGAQSDIEETLEFWAPSSESPGAPPGARHRDPLVFFSSAIANWHIFYWSSNFHLWHVPDQVKICSFWGNFPFALWVTFLGRGSFPNIIFHDTLEPPYNSPRYNAISDTMLFFLGSQMILKKISVGLSRHKKFIYFCLYHHILTKIFSSVEKNRCGKPFFNKYCRFQPKYSF